MSKAKLGSVDPRALTDARLVVHWAAQIVSAAGNSRLPPKDDASHTNLGWAHDLDALVTHPLNDHGLVAGVVPSSLELFIGRAGSAIAHLPLSGKTLAEGLAWLDRALDEELERAVALERPEHEMPAHAIGDGAAFPKPDGPAYGELGQWFHLAHHLLTEVAAHNRDRAPLPRCWPHHFDIATLITVKAHADPEHASSVGVGMTPGDEGYPEPYFYVTPWPYPERQTLPELLHGHWHTEGWTGAVLVGTEALDAEDVAARARAFVDDSLAVTLGLSSGAS